MLIDAANLGYQADHDMTMTHVACRFTSMADATKAMQQLHGLDIGGTAISVKIAAIAATDMAGLAGLNMPTLDDDEGADRRRLQALVKWACADIGTLSACKLSPAQSAGCFLQGCICVSVQCSCKNFHKPSRTLHIWSCSGLTVLLVQPQGAFVKCIRQMMVHLQQSQAFPLQELTGCLCCR